MMRKFTRLASIFFLSLLLLKGIMSIVPSLSSSLKDLFANELVAETETEQKGSTKLAELNSTEELFDYISFTVVSAPAIVVSGNIITDINDNLSSICLDTPTPPPNRL